MMALTLLYKLGSLRSVYGTEFSLFPAVAVD